jgi:hypothetical protein
MDAQRGISIAFGGAARAGWAARHGVRAVLDLLFRH